MATSVPINRDSKARSALSCHPEHTALSPLWLKWRVTYGGGYEFKNRYLKRYSLREDATMFAERKEMTYVPAFAKTGINEIRNSIYQRMSDITRATSSRTYNDAVEGKNGGVDRRGSSMDYFLGVNILTELLVMGKVGIYVDMPREQASNYRESHSQRPYIYAYKAEQIRSWCEDDYGKLKSLILEDIDYAYDTDYGLPLATVKRFRHYYVIDGEGVYCEFRDAEGQSTEVVKLGIDVIPFHCLHISDSLMTDVADYQIALMNMASSDIQFARLANYPLYVEEYDRLSELTNSQLSGITNDNSPETDGSAAKSNTAGPNYLKGGTLTGRRIAKGLKYPAWVSPDSGPLVASMEKQEQMKIEIRTLLNLTLANLSPTRSSADSKQEDVKKEEDGLSYIGFELALAENKIAEYWHLYENNKKTYTIKYPQTYDIKTTAQRIEECSKYIKLIEATSSLTYKKELTKLIARTLLNGRVNQDTLVKIYTEIDSMKYIIDPVQLVADMEAGVVSHATGSMIRGYGPDEAEIANKELAVRTTIIAEAQSEAAAEAKSETESETDDEDEMPENPAARGMRDMSADPKADIKRDRNKNKQYKPRGAGKKPPKE